MFWLPRIIFEESVSRHYESGSRHFTKDPKTDLKSVRFKLTKTISPEAVTQKLKVYQMLFKKNIFLIEDKIQPKMLIFFKEYEISFNFFI